MKFTSSIQNSLPIEEPVAEFKPKKINYTLFHVFVNTNKHLSEENKQKFKDFTNFIINAKENESPPFMRYFTYAEEKGLRIKPQDIDKIYDLNIVAGFSSPTEVDHVHFKIKIAHSLKLAVDCVEMEKSYSKLIGLKDQKVFVHAKGMTDTDRTIEQYVRRQGLGDEHNTSHGYRKPGEPIKIAK